MLWDLLRAERLRPDLLSPRRAPVAVLILAAVLFSWNLWVTDLWAPDEPYFGEGAREMVVDGQWLVPHVNGEITTGTLTRHRRLSALQ